MADLFEREYGKHGNKAVPALCEYVGIVSKEHWNSYICGCNSGGDCDACDSG